MATAGSETPSLNSASGLTHKARLHNGRLSKKYLLLHALAQIPCPAHKDEYASRTHVLLIYHNAFPPPVNVTCISLAELCYPFTLFCRLLSRQARVCEWVRGVRFSLHSTNVNAKVQPFASLHRRGDFSSCVQDGEACTQASFAEIALSSKKWTQDFRGLCHSKPLGRWGGGEESVHRAKCRYEWAFRRGCLTTYQASIGNV